MKMKCIGQLSIIQEDIENLRKEVKKQQELFYRLIKELSHVASINLNLEENKDDEETKN